MLGLLRFSHLLGFFPLVNLLLEFILDHGLKTLLHYFFLFKTLQLLWREKMKEIIHYYVLYLLSNHYLHSYRILPHSPSTYILRNRAHRQSRRVTRRRQQHKLFDPSSQQMVLLITCCKSEKQTYNIIFNEIFKCFYLYAHVCTCVCEFCLFYAGCSRSC